MLSGFVLAFAYQKKLDANWSMVSFFKTRLARLYPLYFLGLLLGFLFRVLQIRFGTVPFSTGNSILLLILGLLILPAPPDLQNSAMFPYNIASWSLFYEIVANLLHSLFLRRRGGRFMIATLVLSGAALFYSVHRLGTMDFGERTPQLASGLSRVLFSYTAGILLFLVWKSERVRIRVSPFIVSILLLASLSAPITGRFQVSYDLLITVVFFPALLLIGAASQPAPRLVRTFQALGTSSYAIYVLHLPFSHLFERIWVRVRGHSIDQDAPWPGLIYMLLTVALALFIDRIYDLRARTFLREKLLGSSKKQLQLG